MTFRLSDNALIGTDFDPHLDIVDRPTETYEEGVWSAFRISWVEHGTLFFYSLYFTNRLACIHHTIPLALVVRQPFPSCRKASYNYKLTAPKNVACSVDAQMLKDC